ncbi:hypothetical protein F4805DRAFT_460950 [Annulohypoxylon moriforme]|nr:hypothetical protein F4805DRAFT_460950 [Annulohypoxylon moriforme]
MEVQQTATPPSSSPAIGMTIYSPMSQAESGRTRFNSFSPVSTLDRPEKARQTTRPFPSKFNRNFQIKLIDLCTENQGTYFKCEDLADFWAEIAHSLEREFPFPITRNDVESWVEEICRDSKDHLLRREISPHRADHEDLDIAIEDWLEIEGRRKFQQGFSEMSKGYLLAYGPEESEEDNLLSYACLNRLRENLDRMKAAMSEKGKASRRNGAILIHKVELLASIPSTKPTQQVLTPQEFYGRIGDRLHENLFPSLNSNVEDPSNTFPLSHAGTEYQAVGPSATVKSTSERPPSELLRPQNGLDRKQSPAINLTNPFSTEELPETPICLKGSYENAMQHGKTTEKPNPTHINLGEEPSSSMDQGFSYQAPRENGLECTNPYDLSVQVGNQLVPGSPAVKKSALDLGSAGKPEMSKKTRIQKGKGVDRSRQPSKRGNSRSTTDSNAPSISSPALDPTVIGISQNTQKQWNLEAGGEANGNSHLAGQEYANALAATPSTVTQKARKNKGAVKKQTLTNKRHLKQTKATSQSSIASQRVPDSLACDGNNLGNQCSLMLPIGSSSTTCQNRDEDPAQNPFGNVPVIDLTRSPDDELVKQELGWAAEGLEGRINRLAARLNGVVGLTPERIKEIIDRSVSASLNDAAHQVVEKFDKTLEKKLDQLRRDWRPLEDNQDER